MYNKNKNNNSNNKKIKASMMFKNCTFISDLFNKPLTYKTSKKKNQKKKNKESIKMAAKN